MKCNIKKDVTSKALYQSDLDCISEGLDLLEQDINQFLERKNFKEISQENALQNLEHIRSVREQLEHNRQSLSLNELKVIYIGLNFLRDDLNAPAQERSEKNRELTDRQIFEQKAGCPRCQPENHRNLHPHGRRHPCYPAWILISFSSRGIVSFIKKEYNGKQKVYRKLICGFAFDVKERNV